MEEAFDSQSTVTNTQNNRRMSTRSVSASYISTFDTLHNENRKELNEINLTRELIDFDVIKGSAFFNTKPANHDRKLVHEGFKKALYLPFHYVFWSKKRCFYEISVVLYALEAIALCMYFAHRTEMSALNTFEVIFPVFLLVVIAIAYGRVSSLLQDGDKVDRSAKATSTVAETQLKEKVIASLVDHVVTASTLDENENGLEAIGSSFAPELILLGRHKVDKDNSRSLSVRQPLDDEIAESEGSDSTDSGDDNNNDSSSSDESTEAIQTVYDTAARERTNSVEKNLATDNIHSAYTHTPEPEPADRRRVKVCVWDKGLPVKRVMSINELRAAILAKVKATTPRLLYRKIARAAAIIVALVPTIFRIVVKCQEWECLEYAYEPIDSYKLTRLSENISIQHIQNHISLPPAFIAISCMLSTFFMASIMFAALADAEITYHRRFLYAKCFTALTSARRSRSSNLPHFRLKNVVNLKAWIALRGGRTWLKRQGRQRAADEIVSTSFVLNLVLLVVMGVQSVSEFSGVLLSQNFIHIEITVWCSLTSIFMLRFMMLGMRINKKYQNTSLLLTEQMNVYLRLLAKPHKKEKLLVSNNVLKLASKLLKELNPPNKVSGLTMNPLLYNLSRVVVLSAFSSVASEIFGFKLKLWKMKV